MVGESALSVGVKRIGIIGAGGMGQVRAKALISTPKAKFHAVASGSVKSASRLAEAFGVSTAVGSYKELEGVGLDAVIVTTPPCFHYEITRWALENGFDVLVEGPLCTEVSEGEELVELAERKGAIVEVGYNAKYSPLFDKAKRILESGGIGEPIIAYSTGMINGKRLPSWYFSREISGGVYLAHMCYVFYRVRWLLGNPTRLVAEAHKKTYAGKGDLREETLTLIFTFPTGAIASISATYAAPEAFPGEGIKVICSKGGLHLQTDRKMDIYHQRQTKSFELPETVPSSRVLQVRAFIEQIERREQGRNPITDAIIDLKIARAIERSLETGRSTEI